MTPCLGIRVEKVARPDFFPDWYMVYLLFYSLVRMGFARSFYCSHVRCRLVVLSPRINVGLRLVIGLNLGGDGPFLRVNVCFSYRARGVILVIPICFLWY